jgi:LAO/AO transport system kinase
VNTTEKELEALLFLASRDDRWEPSIVKTVATESKGIQELAAAVQKYQQFHLQPETGKLRRQSIARWRILELLRERLVTRTLSSASATEKLDRLATEVASRQRDPYSAVDELLENQ